MAKKQKTAAPPDANLRYEYRVWGKHKKAVDKLSRLSSDDTTETIEDCYLLRNEPEWNAKVRDDTLKLKQRLRQKKGFEQWTSAWHVEASGTPTPFDMVFDDLSLDRPQRGKSYDLRKAVKRGLKDDPDTRAVFVTKQRRRFLIGDIKAEVSKIDIHLTDARLHTVAVQGPSIKELVRLLEAVKLSGLPNVPVHIALSEALATDAVAIEASATKSKKS